MKLLERERLIAAWPRGCDTQSVLAPVDGVGPGPPDIGSG
jgi:hypothetical protein